MSFDVQDLQSLQEREPSMTESALLSHCIKHPGCTDTN